MIEASLRNVLIIIDYLLFGIQFQLVMCVFPINRDFRFASM